MNRAHLIPVLALAGALSACSTAPANTAYYAPGAAPVSVAGSSATYSAGTGTVASGVNTFSSNDRVVVGEPASKTTTGDATTAPTGTVIGGSALSDPQGRRPSAP